MSLRNSKLWDRQLEGGLPDSRLSGTARENNTVVYAHMLWERVFCANCGKDGGLITADWSPHVFYVCDDCDKHCGSVPGLIKVDERAARGQ